MTQTEALKLALDALGPTPPDCCGCQTEWQIAITAIKAALEAKDEPVAVYGYCPVCGAKGTSRERHPDGNTTCVNGHKYKSRDTLSAPPQQEAKDEPWTQDDIAYRPNGLPQEFIKHEVELPEDWSEWVCPNPDEYFMKCCDCGLVHEVQYRVARYGEGDYCELVDDKDVQAQFRMRRRTQPNPEVKNEKPWVCECGECSYNACKCVFKAALEAKDEPVVNTDHVICPNCVHQFRAIPQNVQKLMLASGFEPPFTTPPQRTWVGLTDEEICAEAMKKDQQSIGFIKGAEWAEAKLKEKNQ